MAKVKTYKKIDNETVEVTETEKYLIKKSELERKKTAKEDAITELDKALATVPKIVELK